MSQRIQLHKLVQQAERLGRRHRIRPRHDQLERIYDSINRAVFAGALERPPIRLSSSREYWGEIEVGCRGHRHGPRHTLCMRFAREFPSMKTMINTVAHEMVHQWEWERNNNLTHGQAFYAWNDRLSNRGLRL